MFKKKRFKILTNVNKKLTKVKSSDGSGAQASGYPFDSPYQEETDQGQQNRLPDETVGGDIVFEAGGVFHFPRPYLIERTQHEAREQGQGHRPPLVQGVGKQAREGGDAEDGPDEKNAEYQEIKVFHRFHDECVFAEEQ